MKIERSGCRYILSNDYDPEWISLVKTIAGRRYNPNNKTWDIPFDQPISNILSMFSKYNPVLTQEVKLIHELESCITLHGYPFAYGYQKTGIQTALTKKRFLLCDDLGLGKTCSATIYADILIKKGLAKNVLVICPKTIIKQWKQEIKKFVNQESVIIDKKSNFDLVDGWYITNYERIRQDKPKLLSSTVVILDELTKVKNSKCLLYRTVYSAISDCCFVLGMTGTPLENSLMNFYNILLLIYPQFMSWNEFSNNYVEYGTVWNGKKDIIVVSGFKNIQGFREQVKNLYIRRTQDQVDHLLPLNIQVRNIQISKSDLEIEEMLLECAKGQDNYKNKLGVVQLLKSFMSESSNINKTSSGLPQKLGIVDIWENKTKLEELKHIIEETSSKVIVFTCFEDTANFLKSKIENSLTITGSSPDKQLIIDIFKKNKNIKVLISTDTLSYGINLDECDCQINYDMPWNPGILKQRQGRIRRVNSTRQKTVITLLSNSWIENRVYDILQSKMSMFDKAVVEETFEINLMEELMK